MVKLWTNLALLGLVILLVLIAFWYSDVGQDKLKHADFGTVKIDTTFQKMPLTIIPLQIYGSPDSILYYGTIAWSTNAGKNWAFDTLRYPFDLEPPHKKIDEMPNYDEGITGSVIVCRVRQ
jgi:hypothetical protein